MLFQPSKMTPSFLRIPDWQKIFFTGTLALWALVIACSGDQTAAPAASDFRVTLFDGAEFQLSEQIGKNAVVLNFWYPSCPPCRDEMPAFQEAWGQVQGEDVRILGLFVPQGFDSEQDARDFVQESGLTYDFATDQGAMIALDYRLEYFPKTYFIDKSGRVFAEVISALDADQIAETVRAMGKS